LSPALDVGADLGARFVLICGHDPDRARMIDNFGRLCAAANERGLRPMLEFIPYTEVRNLKSAFDVLQAAAPRDAGLLVDALHLSRSGGSPADIRQYDPALFSYMHLCDAMPTPPQGEAVRTEARGGRLYPGEGGLWLSDFLDAFPPGTPVGVEAPNASLASLSVVERGKLVGEATRRLLERHDRAA
jgi:sugar phosphate isomerase/epimerase